MPKAMRARTMKRTMMMTAMTSFCFILTVDVSFSLVYTSGAFFGETSGGDGATDKVTVSWAFRIVLQVCWYAMWRRRSSVETKTMVVVCCATWKFAGDHQIGGVNGCLFTVVSDSSRIDRKCDEISPQKKIKSCDLCFSCCVAGLNSSSDW